VTGKRSLKRSVTEKQKHLHSEIGWHSGLYLHWGFDSHLDFGRPMHSHLDLLRQRPKQMVTEKRLDWYLQKETGSRSDFDLRKVIMNGWRRLMDFGRQRLMQMGIEKHSGSLMHLAIDSHLVIEKR
jgi:hypothetical protein